MSDFRAVFEIVEYRKCPLYDQDDLFLLTDQSVEFPLGRSTCLILVRELTSLLFTLLPHFASNFSEHLQTVFNCGGCTGLIKYQLTEKPFLAAKPASVPTVAGDADGAVMQGQIDAILPAELLQVFHMHQKTGRLVVELEKGPARVTFREGGLLAARYEDLDNQEAIFALLAEKKGGFRFIPGLPEPLMHAREIGDFMMILMEGLRRLDERA